MLSLKIAHSFAPVCLLPFIFAFLAIHFSLQPLCITRLSISPNFQGLLLSLEISLGPEWSGTTFSSKTLRFSIFDHISTADQ